MRHLDEEFVGGHEGENSQFSLSEIKISDAYITISSIKNVASH
jgi:hypothetical protein